MKMTIDKFNERVSKFVWQVVIPDTKDVPTKCVFGAMEKLGVLRLTEKNCAALKSVGIVGDDGSIDVERLKLGVNGAFEAGGGSISLGGILPVNIPKPVVDKLYKFLETETVE
jgi:hypothetical protein